MNKIDELIKEGYRMLKNRKLEKASLRYPSDEDIACYIAGILDSREKEKLLNDIILHSGEEESLKNYFLLTDDICEDKKVSVSETTTARVKALVDSAAKEDILDAVIEFAGNIARVLRTTGSVLTCAREGDLLPVGVFRDSEECAGNNVIEISKAAKNFVIEVKIMRIKDRHINLTIYIKDKKSGEPSSGERVSLVYKDRELRSSLTDIGKVEFDNVRLRDYHLNLIRRGESQCIATLSLRTKGE